jgi:hypothetical protein
MSSEADFGYQEICPFDSGTPVIGHPFNFLIDSGETSHAVLM